MFVEYIKTNPQFFFADLVVVTFSICVHEFSHAWMALREGDSTAADEGHLTLNPMKQMGLISLLMLVLLGIAWGAVPVRPERMRYRWSHALVAFAGPASNVILAVVFAVIYGVVARTAGSSSPYAYFMYVGVWLNIVLFLFNMLPVPILDGYTIYSYFFPALEEVKPEYRNAIFVFIFLGFSFFGGFLFSSAQRLSELLISIVTYAI